MAGKEGASSMNDTGGREADSMEEVPKAVDGIVEIAGIEPSSRLKVHSQALREIGGGGRKLFLLKYELIKLHFDKNLLPMDLIEGVLEFGEIVDSSIGSQNEDLLADIAEFPLDFEFLYATRFTRIDLLERLPFRPDKLLEVEIDQLCGVTPPPPVVEQELKEPNPEERKPEEPPTSSIVNPREAPMSESKGRRDASEDELLDDEEEEDSQKDKYLTFHIGNEDYGIEIVYVTEIVGIQNITEVPDMPNFVKGVINLRGQVIPVIDVRTRFKLQPRAYDDRTCVVVVSINNTSIGLIVDTVNEVLSIPAAQVSPPPAIHAGNTGRYIQGMGKVDDAVKIILNVNKLLFENEQDKLEQIKEG